LTKLQVDKIQLAKWQICEMASLSTNNLTKWRAGEMIKLKINQVDQIAS
jgi:hypothetical protein